MNRAAARVVRPAALDVLERAAPGTRVAGVDEAGRGPLAGPVVAAAVVFREGAAEALQGLDDSKKLTARRRAELLALIREHCDVGVGVASVEDIDALNILQATFVAMRRALAALSAPPELVFVDGNQDPRFEGLPTACVHTVVQGDALVAQISAASIVAKETRDALMRELEERHPGYGFARHAGYGTPAHLAALQALGPCEAHRKSFAPVARLLPPHG